MDLTSKIICLMIGYAAGCFQTAYFVGKKFGNLDIREHGSGNAGSTNVFRVLGKKAGMITFAGDLLKSIIACVFCSFLFGGICFMAIRFQGALISPMLHAGSGEALPVLYTGLGVVLGHNFPANLNFRGGKGIATTIGIILCTDLRISLILILIGTAIIYGTKIVSVTSMAIVMLFFLLTLLFSYSFEASVLCFILFVMAVVRHRANIVRIINGTESKIGKSSK